MDILKVIGIGLLGTIIVSLLKTAKGELAVFATIAVGAVILITVVSSLSDVIEVFNEIVTKTGLDYEMFGGVLKIIGIGYLVEYSAGICSDAGCDSIAIKINMAGKVAVLVMALPIIRKVIDLVVEIIQ